MNTIAVKETIRYQGFLLGLVTALAAAILLAVSYLTAGAIQQQNYQDKMDGLNQVLPPELYNNNLLASEQLYQVDAHSYRIFTGKDATNTVTGYAIQSSVMGYSGVIELLVGLDARQRIIAVRVLSHSETPGLGDKIERKKSDWVDGFNQHSLQSLSANEWAVKKDGGAFDQFTGATITPRAVVSQVHNTLVSLQQVLPQLLNHGDTVDE